MKLTLEDTIRGMITGKYTHAASKPQSAQQTCNYGDNYYGDKTCFDTNPK
jgi:hypothetical protein